MREFAIRAQQRIYDALARRDIDEFACDVTHDFEFVRPERSPGAERATAATALRRSRPSFGITSKGHGRRV